MPRPKNPHSSFRYLNSPPKVIRLVVRRYVCIPLPSASEILARSIAEKRSRNPFAAAQPGDGVIAAQAFEHTVDLEFGGEVPTGPSADVLDHLLGRRFGL